MMMGGGEGPQPLKEHEAQPIFWRRLTQFAAFIVATTVIANGVAHVEHQAHEALGL